MTNIVATSIVFLCVVVTPLRAYAQDSPAATKGKAVGETINAAINAAVPGVTAIGTLIQSLFGGQSEKKVKKDDVTKQLNDQAKTLKAAAVSQLKSLSAAVDEINAANDLANVARVAYESLAGTQNLVTLSGDAGWQPFKSQWQGVARPSLMRVSNFDEKKFGAITNEDIQTDWRTFADTFLQNISDIETFTEQRNAPLVTQKIGNLTASLNRLATIPSVELKAFGRQLSALASQTPDVAPPPLPPGQADDASVKALLRQSTVK